MNTVKYFINFEQQTLTNVIEARAKATQTKIDPSNEFEEQLNEFQQNQNQVGSSIISLTCNRRTIPIIKRKLKV